VVLTLLAILIAALVVLALAGAFLPQKVMTFSRMVIAGLMAILAAVALALPALDPMSASFLLLICIAAVSSAEGGPLKLAGTALALLAADGFVLVVGVALAAIATVVSPPPLAGGGWGEGAVPTPDRSFPPTPSLAGRGRNLLVPVIGLILAISLLGHGGDFAAIRAAPPDGWYAAVSLLLLMIAVAPLIPANAPLALYLLARILLDLSAATQPQWWSIPLLLAGAAIAVTAALRAAIAETLHTVAATATLHQFGLAVMGLGVALFARAVDLPAVATLALEATWLSLACLVLCRALLLTCADAVENGAATRRLDRLGGVIHRMPMTASSCLAGLFALAILPPGLGFAAFWLLFQALLAVARVCSLGLQLLTALATVLTVASVGLAAIAAVRLFGVAFLGRPRTPRTAVAEEAPRAIRLSLAGLAGLVVLLGAFPGLALLPASFWTGGEALQLVLRPGYSATTIAVLLLVIVAALFRTLRRGTWRDRRREAAWSGGFAAPPPWLPFGDPATQYGPVSFTEPLRRVVVLLPVPSLGDWPSRCREALLRWLAAMGQHAVAVTLSILALALAAWLLAS
jgi:hydrogenase-4 component B